MRGLCDLAHRAWRGRGLRHWGSLPLHGQVSVTRGYSLVSLCLVLFDCADASDASFKRPERWCSAGDEVTHALRLTPATSSVAPVRRSDSIAARHRWKTSTLLRFRLFIWTFYWTSQTLRCSQTKRVFYCRSARRNYRHIRIKLAATSIGAPASLATLIEPSV